MVLGTTLLLAFGWNGGYTNMSRAYTDSRAEMQRVVTSSASSTERYLSQAMLLTEQTADALNLRYAQKEPPVIFHFPTLDGLKAAYLFDRNGALLSVEQDAPPLAVVMNNVELAGLSGNDGQEAYLLPAITDYAENKTYLRIVQPHGQNAISVVYLISQQTLEKKLALSLPYQTGETLLLSSSGVSLITLHRKEYPSVQLRGAERIVFNLRSEAAQKFQVASSVAAHELLSPIEERGRVMIFWGCLASLALGLLTFMGLLSLQQLAKSEKRLKKLVATDNLTKLPNRYFFSHHLENMVSHFASTSVGFALFFIDLDNFKYVNDSLGHDAGDELLKLVTHRLQDAVRSKDIVCRLGGDEFTVLLPGLGQLVDAEVIAQRIVELMGRPFEVRGVAVHAHASIGVALIGQHAATASELMRFADAAMYHAKQKGKNRYAVYQASMTLQALAKEHRANDLQLALGTDQFFLHYQPKVELSSGVVAGYEALLRWQHPIEGLISPSQFIPIAEECGAIIQLGQWVVEETVRQQRAWFDEGLGWKVVAVNVSALQLRSKKLPAIVKAILLKHGMEGQYLQMEITESLLVTDVAEAQDTISKLRSLGVSIAVDDFGTGYSSLSTLQKFDINCLKVDRSFVMALDTAGGFNICLAIVNLAHSLEMKVVAEGIETVGQYSQLMELGCEEGQGYFFARPLPPEQAGRFIPNILLFSRKKVA